MVVNNISFIQKVQCFVYKAISAAVSKWNNRILYCPTVVVRSRAAASVLKKEVPVASSGGRKIFEENIDRK